MRVGRNTTRVIAGALVGLAVAACSGGGGGGEGGAAGEPPGMTGEGGRATAPASAEELVGALYSALAVNDAATACALFSPAGEAEFVEGTGVPDCESAVDSIAREVIDPEAFARPTVEIDDPAAVSLDEWCSQGIRVRIPEGALARPSAVAAFGYAREANGTWQVTSYNTQSCG